jgi:hypothetical protein
MSWDNEVKEKIILKSPDGNKFEALWQKDTRTTEKHLGIFEIPKFTGSIVQDMGLKSTMYPLTIFFEGMYHHFFASKFDRACREVGQWEVVHPVLGSLILQLVSWEENIDAIEENITEFKTQWIEPANQERLISPEEFASSILSKAQTLIEDTAAILSQLRADAYAVVNATINIINSVGGAMDNIVQELTATKALLYESYQTAKAALNSALANYGIGSEPDDIATASTEMATIPTQVSTNFADRFSYYERLTEDLSEFAPVTTSDENYNTVIGLEFGMTLSLVAVAQITATSVFRSRSEVISAIEKITKILSDTINAVEEVQEIFNDLRVDQQYYSNTKTYTTLIEVFTLCLQYLTSQFYNLKVEKRIKLKKARSPIEITVTEYGSLGIDDVNYDLFLESNELTANEILLLPALKEVIIYV